MSVGTSQVGKSDVGVNITVNTMYRAHGRQLRFFFWFTG